MQNFEDAEAWSKKTGDPFYLAAFLIQCWLGGLVQQAAAEYAEKKNPKERLVQSGQAWQALHEFFPKQLEGNGRLLLHYLTRFVASDPSPRNSLRRALVPLVIEHDLGSAGSPQPAASKPGRLSTGNANSQPSTLNSQLLLARWCDWLDAAIHLRTHRHFHLAPGVFHPDPERRQLAALGHAQRQLPNLDPHARECLLRDLAAAADRYQDSPKWAAVGKAMAADPAGTWLHPHVDSAVIALWPLVTKYNWTYRDLLNVLGSLAKQRPGSNSAFANPKPKLKTNSSPCTLHSAFSEYPCDCEQTFAAYCVTVLGLRKNSKGRSAKNGLPAGYQIAQRLFSQPT